MERLCIRRASPGDAQDILDIYAPYIENTVVTFEYDVPSIEEFTARVRQVASAYPYLVCEADGTIAGYAYAHRHKERAAYGWNVETSVYLSPAWQGRGIGTALYRALIALLDAQHVKNLYACVTLPNEASVRLHEKAGFSFLGAYHKSGWKNGAWHDVGWFEKRLGGEEAPAKLLPAWQLDPELVAAVLREETERLNDKGES